MKLLLTMNLPYYPARGGANKGNKYLLENLAAKQHCVRVVTPALGTPPRFTYSQLLSELAAKGIEVVTHNGVHAYNENGVETDAVKEASKLRDHLIEQITDFKPDWILVSTEDPSQNLLDAAIKTCPGRVVYIVHTLSFLPFGPQAFFPSRRRAELLHQVAAIIAVGEFVAKYIDEWGGLKAARIYLPVYGKGPFPRLGKFDNRFVTLINPSAVKGISIFKGLAQAFSEIEFAAVPSWGTTNEDRAGLEQLRNVRMLRPVDDIDEVFAQTRLLLVPSLLIEGFPMIVIEAMLRGIPVLASDAGGLPESKLGVEYVLPVRQVERFSERLDANMIPVPIIPEQDLGPWRDALSKITSNRELYEEISEDSRTAALRFVSRLSTDPLEALLMTLESRASRNGERISEERSRNGMVRSATDERQRSASPVDLTPEQRALLIRRLQKKSASLEKKQSRNLAIERAPRGVDLPLSFNQQRLWFFEQLQPGTPAHNLPSAVRLKGTLDVAALRQSLNEVVRRHEVLRTTFASVEGEPVQVIQPAKPLVLPIVELRELAELDRETEAQRLAQEDAQQPFDLSRGPLMRIKLLLLGDNDHILLLTMHHIITDGWSNAVFVKETALLYESFSTGKPAVLPELAIQYADYAVWQREWMKAEVLDKELSYWKRQLAGAPAVLELPGDRRRPLNQTFRGAGYSFLFPTSLSRDLRALSHRENVTLFMALLAIFDILLHGYTGQTDLVVGTTVANRDRAETEGLIGFLVNTLALRVDLSPNQNFRELLAQVREVTLSAYDHLDLPFVKLVEELQPERDLSHAPLFQVTFVLQNVPGSSMNLSDLSLTMLATHSGTSRFDLSVYIAETDQELEGFVEYNTDLFDEATIAQMHRDFLMLAEAVVSSPHSDLATISTIIERDYEFQVEDFNSDLEAY